MKILCVDTSSRSVSCALFDENKLVFEHFGDTQKTHTETLLPMISEGLLRAGVNIDDIGLFAVTAGPGSFTGIRIGIAAVKGLAFKNDAPCAAVSTLLALCYGAPAIDGIICPVMDARRGEVYNALFEKSGSGVKRLTPDRAIPLERLKEELKEHTKKIILVGDGAELCYNYLKSENAALPFENARLLRASSAGMAAIFDGEVKRVCAGDLLPNYLRLSQAEREKLERDKGGKKYDSFGKRPRGL